jgi:hypothetical protein
LIPPRGLLKVGVCLLQLGLQRVHLALLSTHLGLLQHVSAAVVAVQKLTLQVANSLLSRVEQLLLVFDHEGLVVNFLPLLRVQLNLVAQLELQSKTSHLN